MLTSARTVGRQGSRCNRLQGCVGPGRRHGHLVDYNLHDGRSGSTWLDFTVGGDIVGAFDLPTHTRVCAVSDDGESVGFETGAGLADVSTQTIHKLWNSLDAYAFDPEQTLPPGTTEPWLDNTIGVDPETWKNKWVLLHTAPHHLGRRAGPPGRPRARPLQGPVAPWHGAGRQSRAHRRRPAADTRTWPGRSTAPTSPAPASPRGCSSSSGCGACRAA